MAAAMESASPLKGMNCSSEHRGGPRALAPRQWKPKEFIPRIVPVRETASRPGVGLRFQHPPRLARRCYLVVTRRRRDDQTSWENFPAADVRGGVLRLAPGKTSSVAGGRHRSHLGGGRIQGRELLSVGKRETSKVFGARPKDGPPVLSANTIHVSQFLTLLTKFIAHVWNGRTRST